MKFDTLIEAIDLTQNSLLRRQAQVANYSLSIRNWLIGCYIVEFEQKGEERAVYGSELLSKLSKALRKKRQKGFSETQLSVFRQFYTNYEYLNTLILRDVFVKEILLTLSEELKETIFLTLSEKFASPKHLMHSTVSGIEILPTVSEELKQPENSKYIAPVDLITKLSFSHFVELLKLDSQNKKYFYEYNTLKLSWSVRQLRREIESMLFERIGLSKNKEQMLSGLEKGIAETPQDVFKNPYILNFLGIEENTKYSETDLETAIINNLQKFLLELGYGFCFEARQKRIIIDNTTYKIDLVFYHRILKCHVLIDLKIGSFNHIDAGQMNFYLNYYNLNERREDDNPPVGLILCSYKNENLVKYTMSGLDKEIFISKYSINLPKEEELIKLLERDN